MQVTVVAHTTVLTVDMEDVTGGVWQPDLDGRVFDDGSALAEFAGRACYQSWKRPNPETATTEGYLANIIAQKHFSVLEHGTVTFYIEDVSRSLTHELVRHRHLSFSQLSQRFVVPSGDSFGYVVPPLYSKYVKRDPESVRSREGVSETEGILEGLWEAAVSAYDRLVSIHMPLLVQAGVDMHRARKMAREAARAVLPNMTPTAIVVSGNHRSWREFLEKRGSIHADAEIRQLAIEIFKRLVEMDPAVYQDFAYYELDGQTCLHNDGVKMSDG